MGRQVYYQTTVITRNKKWDTRGKNVNAILIRNAGDVNITVNNEPVAAASTYQVINNGLEGELDISQYDIVFDPATAGVAPQVVIREKIYK